MTPMEDQPAESERTELDELLASLGTARPLSEISVASSKVAAIVEAAERAAEDLRIKTEEKVRERIAEADARGRPARRGRGGRGTGDRRQCARREAAAVEAEAREGVRLIHERAAQAREEAEARKSAAVAEASEEALRLRAAGDAYAEEARQDAKRAAREIIAEAHAAARDVLHDGTTLSGHLQELSDSLHRNAERLLNDVKLAHARLTADLDQAAPAGGIDSAPRASRGDGSPPVSPGFASKPAPAISRKGGDDDFEIPEFLPGRR